MTTIALAWAPSVLDSVYFRSSNSGVNWPALLSPDRYSAQKARGSNAKYSRSRPPWQQDYDRIIFSSAFRRLQDKTQVHPLSGSDYVRTRLTHSLEVSSVARSLGTLAGNHIISDHGQEDYQGSTLANSLGPLDIGMITSAAALAHDIGNPPFGHSGEDAIRFWFATSPVADSIKGVLTPEQVTDFETWEGNAEGFRLLSRLQMARNGGGMLLTAATLGAFMKYPQSSSAYATFREKAEKEDSPVPVSRKKPGLFSHDLEAWSGVAEATGLLRDPDASSWCRHPLAYLTEAADDICYRVVDLEDGFRLGLLTYAELEELLRSLLVNPERMKLEARLAAQPDIASRASYLRAVAIGDLVGRVAGAFQLHESQLLSGNLDEPLLKLVDCYPSLQAIGKLTKEKVYSAPKVLQIEAAGFEIIPGLLDLFVGALEELARDSGRPDSLRARKLVQLMPAECLGADGRPSLDPYLRLLDAVDFVAGMTDTFALDLYRKLRGVTVPR